MSPPYREFTVGCVYCDLLFRLLRGIERAHAAARLLSALLLLDDVYGLAHP